MFGGWGSPGIDVEMIGLVAILVGVVGIFLLRDSRRRRGRRSWPGPSGRADEAELIQELHQGLARMESRLDALETLLLERERSEPSKRL